MAKVEKKAVNIVSKSELIELVVAELNEAGHKTTKALADRIVSAFLGTAAEALAEGDSVRISGFGTFVTSKRPAREGRNPQTGAKMKIAASTSVRFRPAKAVKDVVNKK